MNSNRSWHGSSRKPKTKSDTQTGLLHHYHKPMNTKELRIRPWVNASGWTSRSCAHFIALDALSSLLSATYGDQEKQRKPCYYKDLCLYC